jgi:hypothetical protein
MFFTFVGFMITHALLLQPPFLHVHKIFFASGMNIIYGFLSVA